MAVFRATFTEDKQLTANFDNVQYVHIADWYDGDYIITPSNVAQEIQTKNKAMLHNLVVQPIPSDYGKITWDGVTLMIS